MSITPQNATFMVEEGEMLSNLELFLGGFEGNSKFLEY